MATRKYRWKKLTDERLTVLAAKYPQAVEIRTIQVRRPVYSVISMLLQCGLEVPGIELLKDGEEEPAVNESAGNSEPKQETTPQANESDVHGQTQPEPSKSEVPGFLGKKTA